MSLEILRPKLVGNCYIVFTSVFPIIHCATYIYIYICIFRTYKEQVKNIFTPPFVSFYAGFSLKKHLVRAKVYPLFHECGSSGCNRSRCQTRLNVNNRDVFQSFVTKESYKISNRFDCYS